MPRQPLPNPVERLAKLKPFPMKSKGATCFLGNENGEAIAIAEGDICYAVNADAARNGWALSAETYNRLTNPTAPAESSVDEPDGDPVSQSEGENASAAPPPEPEKPAGKSGKSK